MIHPELLTFPSTDNLSLPALLYRVPRSKKALIFLHGCGTSSIFYRAHFMNLAGEMLAKRGIAFFPFNNRGAHGIHPLKRVRRGIEAERIPAGTGYEIIRECVMDIDGAIRLLRRRGFKEFYIAGASTGANKIVIYDHLKKGKTPFKKYILFGGGDDVGIYKQRLAGKFDKYLSIARKRIKKGSGLELVPHHWLPYSYSYRSLVDIATTGGDYDQFPFNAAKKRKVPGQFKFLRAIKKPTLLVYGDQDEANGISAEECMSILGERLKGKENFAFGFIGGGDHSCHGKEGELVTSWINFIFD